jgi:transposase
MERAPQSSKRHPLEAAYRSTVEGLALSLRSLANLLLKSFVRWRRDGTWDRLLAHVQTKSDAVGEVEWEVSVDDTVVRAHQSTLREHAQRRATKTQKGA